MKTYLFGSYWCGGCHELRKKYEHAGIRFEYMETETPIGNTLASQYGIKRIPVTLVVDPNGSEFARLVGNATDEEFQKFFADKQIRD